MINETEYVFSQMEPFAITHSTAVQCREPDAHSSRNAAPDDRSSGPDRLVFGGGDTAVRQPKEYVETPLMFHT